MQALTPHAYAQVARARAAPLPSTRRTRGTADGLGVEIMKDTSNG